MDGTDFRIQQQVPFWTGWYSYKFNGPGLRYEVGLSIQTGWIVWINGPYPPGRWPDINIFRHQLKNHLLPHERVEADDGYRGDRKVDCPGDNSPDLAQSHIKALVRGRHETVNRRMKQFAILHNTFRYDVGKHSYCFDAIAVVTQLNIEFGGEPLYSVPYFTRTMR